MLNNSIRDMQRLTPHMQDLLMECHEKEMMNLEPCNAGDTHHAQGLISRGLSEPRKFITEKGKQMMGLFITALGREYLRKL